jgi:hypothetical protein
MKNKRLCKYILNHSIIHSRQICGFFIECEWAYYSCYKSQLLHFRPSFRAILGNSEPVSSRLAQVSCIKKKRVSHASDRESRGSWNFFVHLARHRPMAVQTCKTSIQIKKSCVVLSGLMRITSIVGHGFQMHHVQAFESLWAVEPSIRQVSRSVVKGWSHSSSVFCELGWSFEWTWSRVFLPRWQF